MKRCVCVIMLCCVLFASACVPETVGSRGVVLRGQPAPSPSVDYAALADKEGLVFVTLTGSKYHKPGCTFVSDPPIAITLAQAEQEGYTPCSRCHPAP